MFWVAKYVPATSRLGED